MNDIFLEIRPYTDQEIPAAMQRLVNNELIKPVASYIYPGRNLDEVKAQILSIKTIKDFQNQIMYDVARRIIDSSIDDFSFDGFDAIDSNKAYLFVSNHRDIVLDSLLLEYALYLCDMPTSEISFGENLMRNQFIVDIGKSNKMYKVFRSGNMREFMEHSQLLSEYIRDRIVNQNKSIWIAQRNGRTKDGNDATDQGICKMFSMSTELSLQSYVDLHIAPMSISYEFEPCDGYKTQEVYITRKEGTYTKQPNEDLISILTGIQQPKGRVHISISPVITMEDFAQYGEVNPVRAHKVLTDIINKRIRSHYHLYPNNYIAYDILNGGNTYSSLYSQEQKMVFEKRFHQIIGSLIGEKNQLEEIFLGIYANPVDLSK